MDRKIRQRMKTENKKFPVLLTEIPKDKWPSIPDCKIKRVFRSRFYLVQEYEEPGDIRRLSICRTIIGLEGSLIDGITWEELQEIKRQSGYGDWYAIEVYPRDCDVVNVANMRHLWVMPEPLNIGWVKEKAPKPSDSGAL